MARGNTIVLASSAAVTSLPTQWPGGLGMFTAEATFGGGTVSLQMQTENGTWVAVGSDTTLTANGAAGFWMPPGPIRVAITTATLVFAYVTRMLQ